MLTSQQYLVLSILENYPDTFRQKLDECWQERSNSPYINYMKFLVKKGYVNLSDKKYTITEKGKEAIFTTRDFYNHPLENWKGF